MRVTGLAIVDLQYRTAKGPVTVGLRLFAFSSTDSAYCGIANYRTGPLNDYYVCQKDGSTVNIVEPTPVAEVFPPDDHRKQGEVLRQYCNETNLPDNHVSCKFRAGGRFTITGPPHVVASRLPGQSPSGVVANCKERSERVTITGEDVDHVTNSFGINNLLQNPEIYPIFSRTQQATKDKFITGYLTGADATFSKQLELDLLPGAIGWIEGENPIERFTGNYYLAIGNTTMDVTNVYFDDPVPINNLVHWNTATVPMTAEQRQKLCQGATDDDAGLRPGPASYATNKQRGTGGADSLVGGRESTTLIARAGSDIVRGASGDDRLFGGPGRDTIYGGPGSDTIVDSRGRAWVDRRRRTVRSRLRRRPRRGGRRHRHPPVPSRHRARRRRRSGPPLRVSCCVRSVGTAGCRASPWNQASEASASARVENTSTRYTCPSRK